MNDNRRRIFDSIVSVDAWHSEFSLDRAVASVHVDVSFLKGKIGDEPDSPVRFEISLKRAEVVFIIPASEPLQVLQSSIRREPPISVQTTISSSDERTRAIAGSVKVGLTAANSDANASVDIGIAADGTSKGVKKVTKESSFSTTGITWAQSKTGDGQYRWELAPAEPSFLMGKAWDAVTEPLLSVKNLAAAGSTLDSVCRIEVRCRREDLLISNVVLKDQSLITNIRAAIGNNKAAAVEAYIRAALAAKT